MSWELLAHYITAADRYIRALERRLDEYEEVPFEEAEEYYYYKAKLEEAIELRQEVHQQQYERRDEK